MGKVMAGGGKTPITPMVPALHTASVAHAAGFDHAVGPDTAGQLLHRPDRILLVEVHDLGALRPGHLQTVLPIVHGENPARAHHEGAYYGELSDGPAAEYRNRVAVRDVGDVGPEVTRGEDVADHDRLLVGDVFGELDAGHAGVGNPGVFGLHAV